MVLDLLVSIAQSPAVRQFVTAACDTVGGIRDVEQLVQGLAEERYHLSKLLEALKIVEEKVKQMGLSEVKTSAEITLCRADIQELLQKTDPSIPENRSGIQQFLGSKKALEQTMGRYQSAGRRLNERMTAWQLQYSNMTSSKDPFQEMPFLSLQSLNCFSMFLLCLPFSSMLYIDFASFDLSLRSQQWIFRRLAIQLFKATQPWVALSGLEWPWVALSGRLALSGFECLEWPIGFNWPWVALSGRLAKERGPAKERSKTKEKERGREISIEKEGLKRRKFKQKRKVNRNKKSDKRERVQMKERSQTTERERELKQKRYINKTKERNQTKKANKRESPNEREKSNDREREREREVKRKIFFSRKRGVRLKTNVQTRERETKQKRKLKQKRRQTEETAQAKNTS